MKADVEDETDMLAQREIKDVCDAVALVQTVSVLLVVID